MRVRFNPLTSQFEQVGPGCSDGANGASTPNIQNITVPTANTEVAIVIPTGSTKIYLKVRDYTAIVKLSYAVGQSGITYITVPRGCSYTEENISTIVTLSTIYIQTTKNNVVIECITWA